jgi:hypothetical protein
MPEDQEIDNLTKQGYDGCTQLVEYMWDSSQGQNIRDKAILITDTVNPQADIQPTWKCEIWVRDVDLLKPGSNKDSEGEPIIPEHITCQAACAYDIYGMCTGMLSLERLNILLHAYNQSKQIGLDSTTQPPVQDAATEIVGLLQRYKLQMSSLNNIGKKARDYNMYCTPRHIMTSLQKWALVTKQKFASPLDFDPSYQAYSSKNTRDTVFGASTNAFDTKFTGFTFCHPNYCDNLLHSLVGHALQSTNSGSYSNIPTPL